MIGRVRTAVAVAACAVLVVGAAAALGFSWGTTKALTTTTEAYGWQQGLAASGSRIHVVYRQLDPDGRIILYRRSADGGGSWSDPVELSRSTAGLSYQAAIRAVGTSVDAVWVERVDAATGAEAVYHRGSTDVGASWGAPKRLSPAASERVTLPTILRVGSTVLVGYTDGETGRVFARRSTDGGTTWMARQALGTTTYEPFPGLPGRAGAPSFAAGSGVIYVAYLSDVKTVMMRRSLDDGATWTPTTTIESSGDGALPKVAAPSSSAVVIFGWSAGTSERAAIRRTADKGSHWAARQFVSTGTLPAWGADVIRAGGKWRLAYARCLADDCLSGWPLWYRESVDGVAWSTPLRFSNLTRPWAHPMGLAYTTSNGRTWAAWAGFALTGTDADIFVRGGS